MKRRADLRLMKHVLDIRQTQQLAAEARAGEAASRLQRLQEQQSRAAEALERDQSSWRATVSGRSLDINLAQAWASVVLEGAEGLRQLQARSEEASRFRAERAEELRRAISRREAAAEIRRDIAAAVRRREEEAALAAVADRFALRSRRP